MRLVYKIILCLIGVIFIHAGLPPSFDPNDIDSSSFYDHYVQDDQGSKSHATRKITHVPLKKHGEMYEFIPGEKHGVRRIERQPDDDVSDYISGVVVPTYPPTVIITPPYIDFKERPVCMASVENINIINTSDQEELHLFSLQTESLHFHASFFKQSVILPGQNTTVSIVFLPRSTGLVEHFVVIQSNIGELPYKVYGQGVTNPYRIHPFLGAKVPADVMYSPPIELYNPHDDTLRIKEVFTSGGFLHLNLPGVTDVNPNDPNSNPNAAPPPPQLWEIPPKQKKTIINLAFMSGNPGKYIGYVNIKTDKDNMILHVDTLVVKGGLHRTPEEIIFDTITGSNEVTKTSLMLLNAGTDPVQVLDVLPLKPDALLSVNFTRGQVIPPGVEKEVSILSFSGRMEGNFNGKLLLRTNDTNPANARMEVPYSARIIHGSLGYLPHNTTFLVSKSVMGIGSGTSANKDADKNNAKKIVPVVKSIVFTNRFGYPLVFYGAEIEDGNFDVLSFTPGRVVQPGQAFKPVTIQFTPNTTTTMYSTVLNMHTNASTMRIPLHVYHGRLLYSESGGAASTTSPTKDKGSGRKIMDFGLMGINETRTKVFNITNLNPVKIVIQNMYTNVKDLSVKLNSVQNSFGYAISYDAGGANLNGDLEIPNLSAGNDGSKEKPYLVLEAGHSALFTAELTSSQEEQRSSGGEITIISKHENLVIPVKYHAMKGQLSITPSVVKFEPAFPGKVIRKPIMAKSTYSKTVHLLSITSNDPRIIPVLTNKKLEANTRKEIGYVLFDPSKITGEDNYMNEVNKADKEALSKMGEPLSKKDLTAITRRQSVWEKIIQNGNHEVKGLLTINSDVMSGYTISVRANLIRPSVISAKNIDFGLTQIGTSVGKVIPIYNPSDSVIYVQLLPFSVRHSDESDCGCAAHAQGKKRDGRASSTGGLDVFFLPPEVMQGELVQPRGETVLGPVYFSPNELEKLNFSLLVKNNLTLIDTVLMMGEGGSGKLIFYPDPNQTLTINNMRGKNGVNETNDGTIQTSEEGSEEAAIEVQELSELLFEIDEGHLSYCLKENQNRTNSSVGNKTTPTIEEEALREKEKEVTKIFQIKNGGNLAVNILALGINGKNTFSSMGFSIDRDLIRSANLNSSNTTAAASITNSIIGVQTLLNISLAPNQNKTIKLHFRPDFTSSVVTSQLVLSTSQGTVFFPIRATIPYAMLPICLENAKPFGDIEHLLEDYMKIVLLAGFVFLAIFLLREVFIRRRKFNLISSLTLDAETQNHLHSISAMNKSLLAEILEDNERGSGNGKGKNKFKSLKIESKRRKYPPPANVVSDMEKVYQLIQHQAANKEITNDVVLRDSNTPVLITNPNNVNPIKAEDIKKNKKKRKEDKLNKKEEDKKEEKEEKQNISSSSGKDEDKDDDKSGEGWKNDKRDKKRRREERELQREKELQIQREEQQQKEKQQQQQREQQQQRDLLLQQQREKEQREKEQLQQIQREKEREKRNNNKDRDAKDNGGGRGFNNNNNNNNSRNHSYKKEEDYNNNDRGYNNNSSSFRRERNSGSNSESFSTYRDYNRNKFQNSHSISNPSGSRKPFSSNASAGHASSSSGNGRESKFNPNSKFSGGRGSGSVSSASTSAMNPLTSDNVKLARRNGPPPFSYSSNSNSNSTLNSTSNPNTNPITNSSNSNINSSANNSNTNGSMLNAPVGGSSLIVSRKEEPSKIVGSNRNTMGHAGSSVHNPSSTVSAHSSSIISPTITYASKLSGNLPPTTLGSSMLDSPSPSPSTSSPGIIGSFFNSNSNSNSNSNTPKSPLGIGALFDSNRDSPAPVSSSLSNSKSYNPGVIGPRSLFDNNNNNINNNSHDLNPNSSSISSGSNNNHDSNLGIESLLWEQMPSPGVGLSMGNVWGGSSGMFLNGPDFGSGSSSFFSSFSPPRGERERERERERGAGIGEWGMFEGGGGGGGSFFEGFGAGRYGGRAAEGFDDEDEEENV
eukprot:TRINITY_DN601_c0_g1_i2.p1 TRINITY_DN601_c0_g1~~TRINITY_DN601_c0_g1_i2.p1  ORF type:complete len:1977 (-),score=611.23 TRINITY_DN601_c0_g1_i2:44-5974(-)